MLVNVWPGAKLNISIQGIHTYIYIIPATTMMKTLSFFVRKPE